jgi:hypothetical protein
MIGDSGSPMLDPAGRADTGQRADAVLVATCAGPRRFSTPERTAPPRGSGSDR